MPDNAIADAQETPTSTLCFIGAGNMASAIIGGLIAKGYPAALIHIADPSEDQRNKLVDTFSVKGFADNSKAITGADAVILAVKPQIMERVLEPLSNELFESKPLIISIAAGITLGNLSQWLAGEVPAIRCMPNTPALVSQGATALFANSAVDEAQKTLASFIFESVGLAIWLEKESELDAVVALSGSGPAYYFLFMEAMESAGVALGLKPEVARALTLQTAVGAATLAQQSEHEPSELRHRVTSPGGTTEQAVNSFQEEGFEAIVAKAMQAAYKRSLELAG